MDATWISNADKVYPPYLYEYDDGHIEIDQSFFKNGDYVKVPHKPNYKKIWYGVGKFVVGQHKYNCIELNQWKKDVLATAVEEKANLVEQAKNRKKATTRRKSVKGKWYIEYRDHTNYKTVSVCKTDNDYRKFWEGEEYNPTFFDTMEEAERLIELAGFGPYYSHSTKDGIKIFNVYWNQNQEEFDDCYKELHSKVSLKYSYSND